MIIWCGGSHLVVCHAIRFSIFLTPGSQTNEDSREKWKTLGYSGSGVFDGRERIMLYIRALGCLLCNQILDISHPMPTDI
jgi:hypothetical protein